MAEKKSILMENIEGAALEKITDEFILIRKPEALKRKNGPKRAVSGENKSEIANDILVELIGEISLHDIIDADILEDIKYLIEDYISGPKALDFESDNGWGFGASRAGDSPGFELHSFANGELNENMDAVF